jgi:hypothetical protein
MTATVPAVTVEFSLIEAFTALQAVMDAREEAERRNKQFGSWVDTIRQLEAAELQLRAALNVPRP